MHPITRRTFLATSGLSTGLGLIGAGSLGTEALAQAIPGSSQITSNFNGTPIRGGDFIWFTAVMKVQGLGANPATIGFTGSISFVVDGTMYLVPVPSAVVNFVPSATAATTMFCNGQWITTQPTSGLSGNVFLDAAVLQAPMPAGFPGGIQDVTWQGTFFSVTPGLKIQWQWAAAVYWNANFATDYSALGVKPVDDNNASAYKNSDHAGTPENAKAYVTGGARGGGGSNFTGSYSGTAAVVPAPASMAASCAGS
jgi:hypothetical protein